MVWKRHTYELPCALLGILSKLGKSKLDFRNVTGSLEIYIAAWFTSSSEWP